jgi:hypothetical protein
VGPNEYAVVDARKNEILQLWGNIQDWRVELGMRPAPPVPLVQSVFHVPMSRLRICRQHPRTDTCADVCSIKDNICDNAEEICRIADDLNGDRWAKEKCANAKASCEEARERCCSCITGEPEPEPESSSAGEDLDGPEWP